MSEQLNKKQLEVKADAAPTDAERAKQAVDKMRDGFQNASGTARAFIGGTARDCNS